mgnify:CR=1 FL=1
MKKMSLQWRLTIITTLFIAVICGCLTLFVYKNGVYYIDLLQDTVDAQSDEDNSEEAEYILIFQMINGMILQMIFPFRYITTKQIIKKEACCSLHCLRFLEVLPHIF